jgi:hypothetical protein
MKGLVEQISRERREHLNRLESLTLTDIRAQVRSQYDSNLNFVEKEGICTIKEDKGRNCLRLQRQEGVEYWHKYCGLLLEG